MDRDYTLDLIRVVKEGTNPALGCTEPVAVAYASSVCSKYSIGDLRNLKCTVSKSIYKNGKSVLIPHTGRCGLELAAAVGFVGGDSDNGFMVLNSVDDISLAMAEELIGKGVIGLDYDEDAPDVFVKIIASSDNEVELILQGSHTHIEEIIVDGKIVFKDLAENGSSSKDFLQNLSFEEIRMIAEDIEISLLDFTIDGVEMNLKAADAGLKSDMGLGLGKKLNDIQKMGLISMDSGTKSRILTAAAADMRMGGGDCPIMTSGGSGNQGLGVIIPIYIVAEERNVGDERLKRSLFFAHAINEYVKVYSGKLSGMCGCAIGAGIGATAAITWMLGGNDEQIAGACNNMFANLSGMICDGAKNTCALKLATSAGEAVLSAHLSLNGFLVTPDVGIVGNTIEDTIKNIGKLSHLGFNKVDDIMIQIIDR
ncbi:MAG: L-serine ammonia-lyase, iron-sulfur-dependent, subunit alpha [Tissierellia bacterium]|nr:L-serine ammonia-lyase, iron-sulfur-dependent, subunit alpha [Tissierellia bacterium]